MRGGESPREAFVYIHLTELYFYLRPMTTFGMIINCQQQLQIVNDTSCW